MWGAKYPLKFLEIEMPKNFDALLKYFLERLINLRGYIRIKILMSKIGSRSLAEYFPHFLDKI